MRVGDRRVRGGLGMGEAAAEVGGEVGEFGEADKAGGE